MLFEKMRQQNALLRQQYINHAVHKQKPSIINYISSEL